MKPGQVCVFQEWMFDLPMQQQSVLLLACRGPDGIAKANPTKEIVARYRASVLKAAIYGRPLHVGELSGGGSFMTLAKFEDNEAWRQTMMRFFAYADELPHHYYMHLMHGAEIIGYKHPHDLFKRRWREFYFKCCDDLHLKEETEHQMDQRLGDWHRVHWDIAL